MTILMFLRTNVPAIAMAFSDKPFPYGPFVPHWVPKQYVQDYFSCCRTDAYLALGTTVEDLSKIRTDAILGRERWLVTLRRHDPTRNLDLWWKEDFDAVILCNGHYSIPYVPYVPGLETYMHRFPDKVFHSKTYRTASAFKDKRVMVIGNSASGHDLVASMVKTARLPVYQSRRSKAKWDGDEAAPGVKWKPVITRFDAETGDIAFTDGTSLASDELDFVIYCTGYQASFPFWNGRTNDGPIWNYAANRLEGSYLHTFFPKHPTLGLVGMPKTLTFRSFEYQAVALARLFAGRAMLPEQAVMQQWQKEREQLVRSKHGKFHDVLWAPGGGEAAEYMQALYDMAGLPEFDGKGRCPPVLDEATRWALENVKKYVGPVNDPGVVCEDRSSTGKRQKNEDEWFFVERSAEKKDRSRSCSR